MEAVGATVPLVYSFLRTRYLLAEFFLDFLKNPKASVCISIYYISRGNPERSIASKGVGSKGVQ